MTNSYVKDLPMPAGQAKVDRCVAGVIEFLLTHQTWVKMVTHSHRKLTMKKKELGSR